MPRYILYIINPISGTGAKTNLKTLIEEKTKAEGLAYQILPSVANGDYSFLFPFVEEKKVTDIVIAGGDGTVSQVVHAFKHYNLNFGIVPCGSGNGLAFAAGIPKNVGRALSIIFNGKPKQIDGYYINNQFACMLTGLGFDAKVAHDFANQPKRGLATYVKETIKNFVKAKTYAFEVKVNEQRFTVDAFFISIANSNQFGNHFTIAPKASLSDGLLDIVIVTRQSRLSMLINTLAQIRGKNKLQSGKIQYDAKGIIYFQCAAITIKNTDEAPMHIDGEPTDAPAKVEIKVIEKCFKLLLN